MAANGIAENPMRLSRNAKLAFLGLLLIGLERLWVGHHAVEVVHAASSSPAGAAAQLEHARAEFSAGL